MSRSRQVGLNLLYNWVLDRQFLDLGGLGFGSSTAVLSGQLGQFKLVMSV